MKRSLLLCSFSLLGVILFSCNKQASSVVPTIAPVTIQDLVGTWVFKSDVGTATINGKTITLGSNGNGLLNLGNTLTFKNDGTAYRDKSVFPDFIFSVSSNVLTLKFLQGGGLPFGMSVTVSNGTLTLIGNDVVSVGLINYYSGVTQYNETFVYTK